MLLNEVNELFIINENNKLEIEEMLNSFPTYNRIDCKNYQMPLIIKQKVGSADTRIKVEKLINKKEAYKIQLNRYGFEDKARMIIEPNQIKFISSKVFNIDNTNQSSERSTDVTFRQSKFNMSYTKLDITSDTYRSFKVAKDPSGKLGILKRTIIEKESHYDVSLENGTSVEKTRDEIETSIMNYNDKPEVYNTNIRLSRFKSDANLILVENLLVAKDAYFAYQEGDNILSNTELVSSMIRRVNDNEIQLFYADDSKLSPIILSDRQYTVAIQMFNNNKEKQMVLKKED